MRGIFLLCALECHRPGNIPGKDEDQVVGNEVLDCVIVLAVLKNYEMRRSIVVREEECIDQNCSVTDIQNE